MTKPIVQVKSKHLTSFDLFPQPSRSLHVAHPNIGTMEALRICEKLDARRETEYMNMEILAVKSIWIWSVCYIWVSNTFPLLRILWPPDNYGIALEFCHIILPRYHLQGIWKTYPEKMSGQQLFFPVSFVHKNCYPNRNFPESWLLGHLWRQQIENGKCNSIGILPIEIGTGGLALRERRR